MEKKHLIKIIVNGAQGKMGKTVLDSIRSESDLEVVATTGRDDNLASAIRQHHADVVIDFTCPDNIFQRVQTIIENKAHPVIGTTGLTLEQIKILQTHCEKKSLGGIIAPNFSLTAVLMMRYARDAAKYFSDAEIIELHHPGKLDAPSGTAKKTAELMHEIRRNKANHSQSHQPIARGENYQDTPIHSVRLPGLVAHQMVIFGGQDETLTIRQDSISRKSFMPGVFLSCRKVMEINHLIYGLENLL